MHLKLHLSSHRFYFYPNVCLLACPALSERNVLLCRNLLMLSRALATFLAHFLYTTFNSLLLIAIFKMRIAAPMREQEFKLLKSARYLIENQGIVDRQNPSLKIYRSPDGTEIKRDKNSLAITHRGKEIIFNRDNSTVRNTFTANEIDRQIQARNNEMQQHLYQNRTQTHSRTISR